jgi:hypothetical protein
MLQNLPKVSKQFRRSTAIGTCRQNCSTSIIFLPVFEWNVEAFKNIEEENRSTNFTSIKNDKSKKKT